MNISAPAWVAYYSPLLAKHMNANSWKLPDAVVAAALTGLIPRVAKATGLRKKNLDQLASRANFDTWTRVLEADDEDERLVAFEGFTYERPYIEPSVEHLEAIEDLALDERQVAMAFHPIWADKEEAQFMIKDFGSLMAALQWVHDRAIQRWFTFDRAGGVSEEQTDEMKYISAVAIACTMAVVDGFEKDDACSPGRPISVVALYQARSLLAEHGTAYAIAEAEADEGAEAGDFAPMVANIAVAKRAIEHAINNAPRSTRIHQK